MNLWREYDEKPSKEELIEYERRIVELSREISICLNETKRHYIEYNRFQATQSYLQKEVGH